MPRPIGSPRTLRDGQRSQVWVATLADTQPALLFETAELLLEAPNWTLDGTALLVNGDGKLWSLDVNNSDLRLVEFAGLPDLNNDHVLAPNGTDIFMSAMDGHIYHGRISGGPVTRVTEPDGTSHFLHGVSTDGAFLAYVEIPTGNFGTPGRLAVIPVAGGPRNYLDTGPGHVDGPEYSPDGDWIYFNTERFAERPGHAQLARIPHGGGVVERLVKSQTVDWFPHLSPDGEFATYITFPAGTLGHPADLDVDVRVVSTTDWTTPVNHYQLFGGQGTINVNSWAPDSRRFAFVSYPLDGPTGP